MTTKKQAGERGPNYDWKHEAEYYRKECDKLRDLLFKVEAQGERDAWERDQLRKELDVSIEHIEELLSSQYENHLSEIKLKHKADKLAEAVSNYCYGEENFLELQKALKEYRGEK